jgi:hypothetical protein
MLFCWSLYTQLKRSPMRETLKSTIIIKLGRNLQMCNKLQLKNKFIRVIVHIAPQDVYLAQ